MNDNSREPELSTNRVDELVSIAKGVFGATPFVGSAMAEIIGHIIPNQRVDRIEAFVRLLDERVRHAEKNRLKQRMQREEVVDLIEDAFTQAARATSQQRLEHIANVVANGLSAEELDQAVTKRML